MGATGGPTGALPSGLWYCPRESEHVSELIVGNRELPPPDTWTFPQMIWCQEYENETWLVAEDEVKAAVYVVRGDAEFSEFKPPLSCSWLPPFLRSLPQLVNKLFVF